MTLLRLPLSLIVRFGPAAMRDAVLRLPFSRFATWMPVLGGSRARVRWRGAAFAVDPSELEGFYKYFAPDGPDPEFDLLHEACANARVFLDVGANQGFYSVALTLAYPTLRAIAFEPDTALHPHIATNIRLNPEVAGRVEIRSAAVSAASGKGFFAKASGTNSGVGALTADASAATPVAVVSLHDVCTEAGVLPEVIKVDVEGAEVGVLEGLGAFAEHVKAIVVELHPMSFPPAERPAFRASLERALAAVPVSWRFLVDEAQWVDALPQGDVWPTRLHAFGRKPV